jgi:hypothetical protein
MRDSVTTALELVGIGCIALAGFLVALPLGFTALGVGCIAIGVAGGRS